MKKLEFATFGGGCFWCMEAVFSRITGIESIVPGYSGGSIQEPTYEQVCSGDTGHAEVIQMRFDPRKISYETLLDWFWVSHDPTTLNRQGGDIGSQYRSVIFYQSANQKLLSYASKKNVEEKGVYKEPIVTEIKKHQDFFPAEDYHHNYYRKNPEARYCTYIIQPKLSKLNLD